MASSHRRPPPARRRSPDTSPSLSGSSMPRGNGSDSGQDMDDNGDADEVIDHSAPAASSTVDMVPHERVEALERLNDDLTRQLADMEHMFQRKLTEQEAEFKDLQFKLEETRSELSAAKREEKELRSKDRQKSTQIGALEADVGKFSKQLETSKAAYTGLQRQYLDQCTSAEKYRNDLRERDETVHSLREAARLSQIQHQKSTEIGALENEDLEDEDSEDEDDVVETRSVRLSKRLDPSKMSPSEVSYSFSERREYSDACTSTESLVLNAEDRQPPKSSPVARNSVVELVTRVDRLATIACHTVTKEQDRVVQALQLIDHG
ncbi:hypothetical protein B0H19DRAFT_577376 [Mycena capillaripes]|nr:hypothetical protein B0H19DRAFT_577376 [Mycena capillaripes]